MPDDTEYENEAEAPQEAEPTPNADEVLIAKALKEDPGKLGVHVSDKEAVFLYGLGAATGD